MYLKPASVVNRVYLSLPIYGISLVRLHFHSASAQTGGRLVLASSPPAPAGQQPSTPDAAVGGCKGPGLGQATPQH